MRGSIIKGGSTWAVRYDEPGAPDRRQRRRGGFRTRGDAQRFLNDTLARVGDGSYIAPSKLTVAQWLEQWLPAVKATVKPQTAKKYGVVVRCHLVPQIGSVRLSALAGAHLTGLYGELAREGLAAGTIRNVHAVISRALSDAVREGKVNRNVAKLARPPRRPPTRATAWTASEVQRFLGHVRGDRLFALWRLAAVSGMRRGELLAVSWRALDLEHGKLSVDSQLLPDRTLAEPKSARGRRTISLDEETVAALRRHRETQLLERAVAAEAYEDHDLTFCNELGVPIYPELVSKWFRRHREAAGIPSGSLHTLRHSCATLMLLAGVSVHVVAGRLGDDPAVVLRTYSHLIEHGDETAAEKVAAALA